MRNGYRLILGTPAIYRIRVQGRLDASWSERLGGLRITRHVAARINRR